MSTPALAFTDVETTHLSVLLGEVWEVGIIRRDHTGRSEHWWQIAPLHLDQDVHGEALAIGHFAERFCVQAGHDAVRISTDGGIRMREHLTGSDALADIAGVLKDTILVANNAAFDDRHMRKLLAVARENIWHYRPTCVITRAEGYLWAIDPQWMTEQTSRGPLSSRTISRRLGVDPPDVHAHEALPDARWAEALYDAVPGPQSWGGADA